MASEDAKTLMLMVNAAVAEMIRNEDSGEMTQEILSGVEQGGAEAVVITRVLLSWITQEHINKCEDLGVDPLEELFRENVELLGL